MEDQEISISLGNDLHNRFPPPSPFFLFLKANSVKGKHTTSMEKAFRLLHSPCVKSYIVGQDRDIKNDMYFIELSLMLACG